jgi:hypothetical protein
MRKRKVLVVLVPPTTKKKEKTVTKTHDLSPGLSHSRKEHGHGNQTSAGPRRPDSERWPELTVKKVAASSVPFGESISRNGKTVWASYHDDQLIAVGASHDEARDKYATWRATGTRAIQGNS